MKDKKKLVISRTLKEVEEMLEDHGFLRIHHSHLVNVAAIEKYIRGEGGTVVMSDGTELDVSRSRKDSLLKVLQSRR
jgi:two-component system LytT family response regulator